MSSSTSKRSSLLPAGPKPPTQLSASLVIAETASLTGTHLICLGENTIIHPRSKLSSLHAPITVGSLCIISERSQIGFQSLDPEGKGVFIEDGVVIETGAIVEASSVGKGTTVEVGAKLGKGCRVGKYCTIGPLCTVAENEVLPDLTVIYGYGSRRIDNSGNEEAKLKMVAKQVEVLRKLIPSNLAKFQ